MFKSSDIKQTLRVDNTDLLAFLLDSEAQASVNERPTLPVSYCDVSEALLLDALDGLGTDTFEVEVVQ